MTSWSKICRYNGSVVGEACNAGAAAALTLLGLQEELGIGGVREDTRGE
jgi:hypothetical protein